MRYLPVLLRPENVQIFPLLLKHDPIDKYHIELKVYVLFQVCLFRPGPTKLDLLSLTLH